MSVSVSVSWNSSFYAPLDTDRSFWRRRFSQPMSWLVARKQTDLQTRISLVIQPTLRDWSVVLPAGRPRIRLATVDMSAVPTPSRKPRPALHFIVVIIIIYLSITVFTVLRHDGWLRGTVVDIERRSLAGELSVSDALPAADGWLLLWVSYLLQVSQPDRLSLSSFMGR